MVLVILSLNPTVVPERQEGKRHITSSCLQLTQPFLRHWSEAAYQTELMTGYFYSDVTPMSRITVRCLEDLGYVVDANRSDTFVVPGTNRRLRTQDVRREYGLDALTGPFYRINSTAKPGKNITILPQHDEFWQSLLP